MNFLGIKFEVKRESRWVSREEIQELSAAFQNAIDALKKYADDISDGVDTNRKAIDTYRKKLASIATKGNGDLETEFEDPIKDKPAPVDFSQLPTGTPVNF
jgi:hypothetical protein